MSNWRNSLLWNENDLPDDLPSGGFIPTNKGMQTPEDLVDDLTYSSYAYNRELGVSSDGWKKMMNYGVNDVDAIQRNNAKVDAMERRYISENTQNMSLNWAMPSLKPPVNYRHFFNNQATRKPSSWDAMTILDFNDDLDLPPSYKDMLLDLNVFDGSELKTPWQYFPSSIPSKEYTEFILNRKGAKYYVNTEGYDYPRYMFEILNYPG